MRKLAMTLLVAALIATTTNALGIGGETLPSDDSWLSRQDAAQIAADTGLSVAVAAMRKKLATEAVWDNNSLPSATDANVPACDAIYSFSVTGAPASGFTVTSHGRCGTCEQTVTGRLSLQPAWFGILAEGSIAVKSVSVFTTVFTNSVDKWALLLNGPVLGDVVFGPGGDPEIVVKLLPKGSISGWVGAAEGRIELPSVPTPAGLPPRIYQPGVPLQSGIYEELSISGQATVDEPDVAILVRGRMTVLSNASIVVSPGASLALYLTGKLDVKQGGSFINENNDALTTRVYGLPTCTSIDLQCPGTTYAVIYAPQADLRMDIAGEFHGAVVCGSLEAKNSGAFYYDRYLSEVVDPSAAFLVVEH